MPVYKVKSGRYKGKYFAQVNFVTALGNYKSKRSKYFDTKREAEAFEHTLATNTNKGSDITFGYIYKEFLDYKRNMVSAQTFVTYRSMWKYVSVLQDVPIESLNAKQYKEFKDYLDSYSWQRKNGDVMHLSLKYKNELITFVKQLINYCDLMYDVNNKIPTKLGGFTSHDVRKEMNIMSEPDFLKFIEQFKDDIVFESFFRCLYYEGVRKGEANGLTWKCVDFENNTIHIKQTVYLKMKGVSVLVTRPKTSKSDRIIPMQKSVAMCLKSLYNYYSKIPEFTEEWYCFGGFKPLSETTIDNRKNQACDNAGVDRIRIHDFRHSFVSLLISKGADVVQVSRAVGHSTTTQTLNTYSHMFKNALADTFAKL